MVKKEIKNLKTAKILMSTRYHLRSLVKDFDPLPGLAQKLK